MGDPDRDGIVDDLFAEASLPADVVDMLRLAAVRAERDDREVYLVPSMAVLLADEIERLREVIKAAREVAAMCRDAIDRDDDSPMRDIGRPEDQERVIRLERALAAYDNSSD